MIDCPRRNGHFTPPRFLRRLDVRLSPDHARLDALIRDAVDRNIAKGAERHSGIFAELLARQRRRAIGRAVSR